MAKFDKEAKEALVKSLEGFKEAVDEVRASRSTPLEPATGEPTTSTFEGGEAWNRTPAGELFLLAVSNFVKEGSFYEVAGQRDKRFADLIQQVVKHEPEPGWFSRFVPWLRNTANMRSAPLVMAIEAGRAGLSNRRFVLASAMSRADEPGEAVAYWISQHGKARMPSWFKRGVFDAAKRLYTERAVLQYDGQDKAVRFADVIDLTALDERINADLWKHLQDRRHGHVEEIPESLGILRLNAELRAMPVVERRRLIETGPSTGGWIDWNLAELLSKAGMRWSDVSGWLQGPMDAKVWEALIPSMGYMALLRNLRNFDQAGISEQAAELVTNRLTTEEEVMKSRQFPIRFYSAYKAVQSDRWLPYLTKAADLTLVNIPVLPGRTLILVDQSGSMSWSNISERSQVKNSEIAALFGTALAMRSENADLYAYGSGEKLIKVTKGASILRIVSQFPDMGGTETMASLARTYNQHDRVVIITDEQAWPAASGYRYNASVMDVVGRITAPMYTFNLVGYPGAHMPGGGQRYTIGGGLTDGAFALINAIEERSRVGWPF